MSKHTPGPWTVVLRGERGTFHIPVCAANEADNWNDGADGYTVSKANARLIAAAPELLEACKKAEKWLEGWASAEPYISILRAAIAKGEQA